MPNAYYEFNCLYFTNRTLFQIFGTFVRVVDYHNVDKEWIYPYYNPTARFNVSYIMMN